MELSERASASLRSTHRRRRSTGNGNIGNSPTGSPHKIGNSPKTRRILRLHEEELEEVVRQSGLDPESVHEKFAQFCTITEGKPSKVLYTKVALFSWLIIRAIGKKSMVLHVQ
jgi:hypothetical protein